MSPPDLVATLQSRGITVAVSGGNLVVHHDGGLTDADRDLIRTHKPALLALLAPATPSNKEGRARPIPDPDDPRYLRTCTRCGTVRPWCQPCIVIKDPATGEKRVVPPTVGLEGTAGWTDFGCPRCGNFEFSLPSAPPDYALEPAGIPVVTGMVPPVDDRPACPGPWFLGLSHRRRGTGGKDDVTGYVATETDLTLAVQRDVRKGDRWLPWHGEPHLAPRPEWLEKRIASKKFHVPEDDEEENLDGNRQRGRRQRER
jgi:hypothetical protein